MTTSRTLGDPSPCCEACTCTTQDQINRCHGLNKETLLRAALIKAVEVIQGWHNMGIPAGNRSDLWDIYWRNAPEMKLIREALTDEKDVAP